MYKRDTRGWTFHGDAKWPTHTPRDIPALQWELILLLSLCISCNTASSLLTISTVTPWPPSPRHLGLYVRRKWLQARSTTSASSALTRRLSLTRALTVPSTFSRSCLHGRVRSTCNFQSTWARQSQRHCCRSNPVATPTQKTAPVTALPKDTGLISYLLKSTQKLRSVHCTVHGHDLQSVTGKVCQELNQAGLTHWGWPHEDDHPAHLYTLHDRLQWL